MEDNERTVKQNYLRTEIVEKGLDSEQFINYLCEIKGEEAADIDIWSLDELKEAVSNFQYNMSKESANNYTPSQKAASQTAEGNISNTNLNQNKTESNLEPEDNGPMPKDVKYN